MENKSNMITSIALTLAAQSFLLLDNYTKYSEKVELFVSRYEAKDGKLQLENILNETENGVLITNKLEKQTV
jgi:hypothetical protein